MLKFGKYILEEANYRLGIQEFAKICNKGDGANSKTSLHSYLIG